MSQERPGVIKTGMWRNIKAYRSKTSIELAERHRDGKWHKKHGPPRHSREMLDDAASVLRCLSVNLPIKRVTYETRDNKAMEMDEFADKYAVQQSRQDTLRSRCVSYFINTKPLLHHYQPFPKPL